MAEMTRVTGVMDYHLQEAGSSRSSVARGLSFQVIMCKRPVHPDDHLQQQQQPGCRGGGPGFTRVTRVMGGGVTRVTGVTRGDRQEGGEEGNGEGGERVEDEGKLSWTGRTGRHRRLYKRSSRT